jgi:hypothetical protein
VLNLTMKKVVFAANGKIRAYRTEVDELLLAIAVYMIEPGEDDEDWARDAFVSDESRIGDFLSFDPEVKLLSESLGLPQLSRKDFICDVAETLHQRKNPN